MAEECSGGLLTADAEACQPRSWISWGIADKLKSNLYV